jgi:ABC-type transporter Mla subunit MlaD
MTLEHHKQVAREALSANGLSEEDIEKAIEATLAAASTFGRTAEESLIRLAELADRIRRSDEATAALMVSLRESRR